MAIPFLRSPTPDLIWHDGPPPHVGWWNASRYKAPRSWRWWDGADWSIAVNEDYGAPEVANAVLYLDMTLQEDPIKWRHYYPTNARVPRIAP